MKGGKKMKKHKKILSLVLVILCLLVVTSICAFALTPSLTSSTTLRNSIASNWTYKEKGYYENNCLAWSLGNTTQWIWPWGSFNPSVSGVNTYLSSLGYSSTSLVAYKDIYAYGTTSSVTHFAKGLQIPSVYPISAKWGHYEAFYHSSINPYYTSSYGSLVAVYEN